MKKKSFILGLILLIIHIVLIKYYRPYIYTNEISDFHIADTLGSLFCVPVTTLLILGSVKKKWNFYQILFGVTFANIFYECSSLFFHSNSIDIPDLCAIFIGSFMTFILHYFCISPQNANPTIRTNTK